VSLVQNPFKENLSSMSEFNHLLQIFVPDVDQLYLMMQVMLRQFVFQWGFW
jgi:hypothetical protein